jgi:threonine/homoserine/homoserine lactone efflux protein
VGGGLYLLWLALRSLHAAFAPQHARVIVQGDDAPRRLFRNLKEGFLTNLLNPSIASFYLVVIPQFVPRDAPIVRSVLLLTLIHVCLALTWRRGRRDPVARPRPRPSSPRAGRRHGCGAVVPCDTRVG